MELIVIFVGAIILDIVFTLYVRRSAEGRALQAALYATLIALSTGLVTLGYVKHGLIGVTMFALGSFIGTYITIKGDIYVKEINTTK